MGSTMRRAVAAAWGLLGVLVSPWTGERHRLNREPLRAVVSRAVRITAGTAAGAGADNADALVFAKLSAWQLTKLRRALAELIIRRP